MAGDSTNCIYCAKPFNSAKGQGDHIIPVQLGAFRGDVRFPGACAACNAKAGASEQQLPRAGPENFFRAIVKPAVPRKRQRSAKSKFGRAMGAAAPKFTVDHGDHSSLVDPLPDDPRSGFPVDQLVLRDDTGREEQFRLFPGTTADRLHSLVAEKACWAPATRGSTGVKSGGTRSCN